MTKITVPNLGNYFATHLEGRYKSATHFLQTMQRGETDEFPNGVFPKGTKGPHGGYPLEPYDMAIGCLCLLSPVSRNEAASFAGIMKRYQFHDATPDSENLGRTVDPAAILSKGISDPADLARVIVAPVIRGLKLEADAYAERILPAEKLLELQKRLVARASRELVFNIFNADLTVTSRGCDFEIRFGSLRFVSSAELLRHEEYPQSNLGAVSGSTSLDFALSLGDLLSGEAKPLLKGPSVKRREKFRGAAIEAFWDGLIKDFHPDAQKEAGRWSSFIKEQS